MSEPTRTPQPGDLLPDSAIVVTHMTVAAAAVLTDAGGSDAIVVTAHGILATGESSHATLVLPPEGVARIAEQLLTTTAAYQSRHAAPGDPAPGTPS